jgi:hypothetical protein
VNPPSVGWFGAKHKNFSACPHCIAKGDSGMIGRTTDLSPLISRSDGATYHLFLRDGPNPRYGQGGGLIAGQMIATFCHTQDNCAVKNEPLRILLKSPGDSRDEVTKHLEDGANRLVFALESGTKLAGSYTFEDGLLRRDES